MWLYWYIFALPIESSFRYALHAALQDPRFSQLAPEVESLEVSVTLLDNFVSITH